MVILMSCINAEAHSLCLYNITVFLVVFSVVALFVILCLNKCSTLVQEKRCLISLLSVSPVYSYNDNKISLDLTWRT